MSEEALLVLPTSTLFTRRVKSAGSGRLDQAGPAPSSQHRILGLRLLTSRRDDPGGAWIRRAPMRRRSKAIRASATREKARLLVREDRAGEEVQTDDHVPGHGRHRTTVRRLEDVVCC